MKKFKRMLAVGMMAACILSLAGCGSEEEAVVEEKVEEQAEESAEPEPVAEEPAEEVAETAEGIRPEFKEMLDSYETFFNEYADFMERYKASDDVASMMGDYASYMAQYAEFMQKLDEVNNENMSTEEAAYFLEVSARITERLAAVAQ